MYTDYFGFHEEPFNLTSTSHFFYTTPVSLKAYTQLLSGIKERKGLMVLTGEVGTGKTSLLHRVMKTLESDPSVRFALYSYMGLSFDEMLTFVCDELGVAVEEEGALLAFTTFVQTQAQAGVTTVLLIDEAQNLAEDVLEELAALVNPQTANTTSLQIILVGQQPELEDQLKQPRLSSLKQSIAQLCQLVYLESAEVAPFIDYRLLIAGYTEQELFSPEAIQLITAYSEGIPRVINLICDNALRLTCDASLRTVSAQIIQDVAHQLQLSGPDAMAQAEPQERNRERPSKNEQQESVPLIVDEPPARFLRPWSWAVGMGLVLVLVGLLILPFQRTGFTKIQELFNMSEVLVEDMSALLGYNSKPADKQRIAQGEAVLARIAKEHPEVRPMVWGMRTTMPALALLIPEPAWTTLSKQDQENLTWYLEGVIPEVRNNPDLSLGELRTAPDYEDLQAKVSSLCGDCWVISVGSLALGNEGILFPKVVVQGDSMWEQSSTHSRGVKASEFRSSGERSTG